MQKSRLCGSDVVPHAPRSLQACVRLSSAAGSGVVTVQCASTTRDGCGWRPPCWYQTVTVAAASRTVRIIGSGPQGAAPVIRHRTRSSEAACGRRGALACKRIAAVPPAARRGKCDSKCDSAKRISLINQFIQIHMFLFNRRRKFAQLRSSSPCTVPGRAMGGLPNGPSTWWPPASRERAR
jgi:hypothetical protein